jgi:arylsulfatase A-like enzyme
MLVGVKCESIMLRPLFRLLTLGLCLGAAAGCSDSDPESQQPNLLLITVDTLRADHLGAWGDMLVDTPALDAFAAASFVYEDAFTAIPITTPSLASMLTGVLPRHHGALNNSDDISFDLETLPMALAELGYETAAFLPTFLADKPGFKRGFRTYDFPAVGQPSRPGSEVVSQALAWFEDDGSRDTTKPWFVWVHLVDPHAPYDPGPELEEKYLPTGTKNIPARLREEVFLHGVAPPEREIEIVRALYRGDVELTDRALAPLLEFANGGQAFDLINSSGVPQSSERELITLFTADHGEMLGEQHGYVGHTGFLDEQMLRVPFLIHFASGAFAGRKSSFAAYTLDVTPTLHELAGGSGTLAGSSYEGGLPLLSDDVLGTLVGQDKETLGSRFLVHETFAPEGFFDQVSARSGGYKLTLEAGDERPGGLYFLDSDPMGAVDLHGSSDQWNGYQRMRVQSLGRGLQDWLEVQNPVIRPDGIAMDSAFQDALEAMGYLGSRQVEDEGEED